MFPPYVVQAQLSLCERPKNRHQVMSTNCESTHFSRVTTAHYFSQFLQEHDVHTGSGANPASPIKGYRVSFPGITRPRCDVDHSPPASAEVKNEWMYTSTSHIRLHGVERDNFNSSSIINPLNTELNPICQ